MKLLKISSDGRRIEREDGQSIYLIGDTAWELFHKLNADEARFYLETRKRQGFNLIQAVVLAELDGLDRPNAYGRVPLKRNSYGNFDPCLPDTEGDYSYFDHVEAVLNMAEEMGLYVGLLPTWGDKYNLKWGKGPVIFTPENAYVYGRWLAERFIHHSNIIWILGGDRPMESEQHIAVNDGLAKGVREGDGGKFLITLHPCGCQSSSMNFHLRDWLDFNMIQSGHSYPLPAPSYEMLARDRAMHPIKPVMDGEQLYEDHAKNFKETNGCFDAVDVRVTMYRNRFSGTCG
ncbi:MAG: DUF4038 domain-containing protein, partial [Clostridia bacterium]|nr:DUF4038 domain-containing protein [Clostridia bacterium]